MNVVLIPIDYFASTSRISIRNQIWELKNSHVCILMLHGYINIYPMIPSILPSKYMIFISCRLNTFDLRLLDLLKLWCDEEVFLSRVFPLQSFVMKLASIYKCRSQQQYAIEGSNALHIGMHLWAIMQSSVKYPSHAKP